MRRRSEALACSLALTLAAALAGPAVGQQVSAAPLSQVDSWGVGWLSANEGAAPTGLWSNTNADALGPIFTALQPKDLSPAARTLLRRIVLSRSKSPAGGPALVPERLHLIEQLGETANSADLRKRYPDTDWGKSGERLGIEIDLGCILINGFAIERSVIQFPWKETDHGALRFDGFRVEGDQAGSAEQAAWSAAGR